MKNLLLFLFGLLLLAGCGKDKDDPKPKTASETVVGLYTLSSYSDGTGITSLPTTINGTNISGTINVAAIASQDVQVDVTLTIKASGNPDQSITFTGVQLQAATTGGGYTMTYNGQSLGTVDGTTVIIVDDTDVYTAKK